MTQGSRLSTIGRARRSTALSTVSASIGVLSIQLDGVPCRVGCPFCYLGARTANTNGSMELDLALVEELLAAIEFDEVAVALSEPIAPWLEPLARIVAAAHKRGKPVAVTTTAQVIASCPALLEGVRRVNLSVDPRKGSVAPAAVERAAAQARGDGEREVVLIASLVTPEFAERLVEGLLAELIALPSVNKVALNALKPPPPWCDRAFWLRTCARLAPLLAEHLDRRLFLDCYVAARILGLGGCPARADVSPGPEFRACVYSATPDFRFSTADELKERLAGFVPPAVCPFPIL